MKVEQVIANFELAEQEGSSKVMPLSEAIRSFVKQGMTIHFGYSYGRPNAAVYELIRQFYGKDPQFTIVTAGLVANQAALISCGLTKKVIASFCGDNYPTSGPNKIFQEAFKRGTAEIENWSLLTLMQRLMAGAMGIPFIATRSLKDSSMSSNPGYGEITDPFSGDKVGIVKALHPDVVLVHGLAADEHGNVILSPPYGEWFYGSMASRKGVIVTVEKLVSTEFIRKHAAHVKIPGYLVKSVSVAPFGSHPYGVFNPGIEGIQSYVEDNDFIVYAREQSKSEEKYAEWVEEWILGCKDHSGYLEKLGAAKRQALAEASRADVYEKELTPELIAKAESPSFTADEMMVAVAARKIMERMRENEYRTILAGVGLSNLAAWSAASQLKQNHYDAELMSEIGMYGYVPRPGEPFIFSNRNLPTCKLFTDVVSTLGLMVSGANNPCIGAVGAAQIDRFGNVNSTYAVDGTFMVGSGGANDIASGAQELVVTVKQSKGRFVAKLPYVTSPGNKVRTVVSSMGVFEKLEEDGELVLTACFLQGAMGLEQVVESVRKKCGWELRVHPKVRLIHPPTVEELKLIRLFDPNRIFFR